MQLVGDPKFSAERAIVLIVAIVKILAIWMALCVPRLADRSRAGAPVAEIFSKIGSSFAGEDTAANGQGAHFSADVAIGAPKRTSSTRRTLDNA
jgi:hypothetical protein